jgi:hypothetical protein
MDGQHWLRMLCFFILASGMPLALVFFSDNLAINVLMQLCELADRVVFPAFYCFQAWGRKCLHFWGKMGYYAWEICLLLILEWVVWHV